jgi:acyl-CoA dehydrogenase
MRAPVRTDADVCWGGRNWQFASAEQASWLERMAERGWTAPTWPRQYGGGGLDKGQAKVLAEELRAIGARSPLDSFGLWMIGPALLQFGSESLKQQHLPPIVRGEIRWCQGYSEPNAGSDLAALQTRAEDRGDHYLVSGQKVWTSYADKADWMFCLVRTDPETSKHGGISLVLFDMETPGVSTRPIRLISGNSPFCETFLDEVRVEKDQVVGEPNQGWPVAKYLLTHEREAIGDFLMTGGSGRSLSEIAVDKLGLAGGRLADGALRAEIALFEIDAKAFALTSGRIKDELKSAGGVGHASAMMKLYGTELNKRRNELLLALGGSDALLWGDPLQNGNDTARHWLRSKGNSIEGGTSEIQLNIISKRILGLG